MIAPLQLLIGFLLPTDHIVTDTDGITKVTDHYVKETDTAGEGEWKKTPKNVCIHECMYFHRIILVQLE